MKLQKKTNSLRTEIGIVVVDVIVIVVTKTRDPALTKPNLSNLLAVHCGSSSLVKTYLSDISYYTKEYISWSYFM